MKKTPTEHSPEQLRIIQALYGMPFLGGANFSRPEPGHMTFAHVATDMETIQSRLIALAEDYRHMQNELDSLRKLIAGGKAFLAALLPTQPAPSISFTMPPDTRPLDVRLRELLVSGKLIDAIKLYRAETGQGLKESKDYIDKLRGWKP